MARYFLEVSYNGTLFHGSQVQGDTPTVQLALNKALQMLFRTPIITLGASRTDEGVHALCNVYHFDTDLPIHPHFQYKLNAILPFSLSVNNVYTGADDVNARFDAVSRRYRYRIYGAKNPFLFERALYFPYRLDYELLHETAAIIQQTTSFESFAKRGGQTKTFLCRIDSSAWEQHRDEWHYVVTANRFLRGMVRALVGTQLQVARGKYTVEDFKAIIAAKDCTKADFSVAGFGLYLEKIEYGEGKLQLLPDQR